MGKKVNKLVRNKVLRMCCEGSQKYSHIRNMQFNGN